METDVEHIFDCLDRYGKGELTEKQLIRGVTDDEEMFLIMHQGLLGGDTDSEEGFNVLDWLREEEPFFMIMGINENLCRKAELILEEIGVEMPDIIENFLEQSVETRWLPIVVNN